MRPDMAQYLAKGGMDNESAIYKAITRIQSHYRGYAVRKVRLYTATTRLLGKNFGYSFLPPAALEFVARQDVTETT